MVSGFDKLRSKDPVIAELARGFNKLYLAPNKNIYHESIFMKLWNWFYELIFMGRFDVKPKVTLPDDPEVLNCYSAFDELKLPYKMRDFLNTALVFRREVRDNIISDDGSYCKDSLETIKHFSHKGGELRRILFAMHTSKIISLDPAKPFMVIRNRHIGNYVQIGERWSRDVPSYINNTVNSELYADYYRKVYRNDVKDLKGTDFEKYLTKEMSEYCLDVRFRDGICYLNIPKIINLAVKTLIFDYNDSSDFSLFLKLIPQIVPDIVIEYIKLTMVIPRKHEVDYDKLKYNQVQRDLEIDYSVLKDDLPIYHPEVVKILRYKYQFVEATLVDVLPNGTIRRLLEYDSYMKTLSPALNEFDYPN